MTGETVVLVNVQTTQVIQKTRGFTFLDTALITNYLSLFVSLFESDHRDPQNKKKH